MTKTMWAPVLSALLVTSVLFFAGDESLAQNRKNPQAAPTDAPNILYIVMDDADPENMEKHMPKTRALIADKGASFSNAYVAQPVCCPSRASALVGEYPHNTRVESNDYPMGGWEKFREMGHEARTLGVKMRAQGYQTALIGKYLNHYKDSHVPQGWSTWWGRWSQDPYNYTVTTTNGKTQRYGSTVADYGDKVTFDRAQRFATNAAGTAWFAYVSPQAPHSPYADPPGEQPKSSFAPPPSYNEEDVSDKPQRVRNRPLLTDADLERIKARDKKRALLTSYVDDRIATLVMSLQNSGQLANTYIVVTSDNGWMEGEHRIPGSKGTPYEESVRAPLWVRGPNIPVGTVDAPVSNVDLFATFSEITGAPRRATG
jgi:arylsulfatase A-like enzyme